MEQGERRRGRSGLSEFCEPGATGKLEPRFFIFRRLFFFRILGVRSRVPRGHRISFSVKLAEGLVRFGRCSLNGLPETVGRARGKPINDSESSVCHLQSVDSIRARGTFWLPRLPPSPLLSFFFFAITFNRALQKSLGKRNIQRVRPTNRQAFKAEAPNNNWTYSLVKGPGDLDNIYDLNPFGPLPDTPRGSRFISQA